MMNGKAKHQKRASTIPHSSFLSENAMHCVANLIFPEKVTNRVPNTLKNITRFVMN